MIHREKKVIGWREWVTLPALGVSKIKVKVDTGARTSALHVSRIEPFVRRGRPWVRFEVHPIQRDSKVTVRTEAPVLTTRLIRPSSGVSQRRFVITTELGFLGESWPIEVTLASRDVMGFRMLLGRQAVRGRFVVDPGRSYVAGGARRKAKKKSKRESSRSARVRKGS